MPATSKAAHFTPAHAEYAVFVKDIWVRPGDRSPSESVEDLGGFAVAALGLAGESVEVYDEVEAARVNSPGQAPRALIEELGDVRYYWFRLCQLTGLDPRECMGGGPSSPPGASPPLECAKALVFSCCRAAEAVKKHLRDGGHDAAQVKAALHKVDACYATLVDSMAIEESTILATNRAKLTQRFASRRRTPPRA